MKPQLLLGWIRSETTKFLKKKVNEKEEQEKGK